jgi:hypothetical protein
LPDISALNGTAVDNVREFDGLTVTFLLDTYTGAAAGYSVRQLKSGVTIAMRVRRVTGVGNTGNDDEADIAFDSGVISLDSAVSNFSTTSNATNLGQFLNATGYTDADSLTVVADGFVDEWKDQSGNGNDATQATPASQPQIFDSASPTDLITDNGKPALDWDYADCWLEATDADSLSFTDGAGTDDPITITTVQNITDTANLQVLFSKDEGSPNREYAFFITIAEKSRLFLKDNGGNNQISIDNLDTVSGAQQLQSIVYDASEAYTGITHYQDGSAATMGDEVAGTYSGMANTSAKFQIGRQVALNYFKGNIQEIILWPVDQDNAGNRTGIETDINGFFGIY